jgi:acyl carrier protein
MSISEQVVAIIFEAIDEANEVRPKHEWIVKDRGTALLGGLDSLGLLNLVLAVESRVNAKLDAGVDLAGLLSADPGTSPLKSVATLAEHVRTQLEGAS